MFIKNNTIACCVSLAAFFSQTASADGGAISIGGTIAEAGCTFSGNNINLAFGDITTVVGKVSAGSELATFKANATSLSNCPAVNYTFRIDGDADDNNPELFKINDGEGQASGVAYRLTSVRPGIYGGSVLMSPGSETPSRAFPAVNNIAISVMAVPVTTLAQVTPGTINGTYTFTVTYQ